MNGAGVYIFDSETDFITAMATIKKNCNAEPRQIIYLKHHLNTVADVRKQINILNGFYLNCFQGFITEKLIKLCVTDSKGNRYNITYSFNDSGFNYRNFYNYLRKREQTYI